MRQGLIVLFVEGKLIAKGNEMPPLAEGLGPSTIGGASYDFPGRHGFVGIISEVLFYDTALEIDVAKALSSWLTQKYSID